jgi:hypothetical protein
MEKHKNQLLKKVWYWIKLASLLLGLICGGLLIYNWWSREQELTKLKSQLAQKEQEAQQQYQLQNIHLISTSPLANSQEVHSFFSDLLRNYAGKFAKKQDLNISHYPLNFAGFYSDKKVGSGYGEKRGVNSEFSQMGRCFTEKVIYTC